MKLDMYVTASEIGEYVYCKRGWWLRTQREVKTTPVMQAGTNKHQDLANNLTSLSRRKVIASIILLIGLISMVMILGYWWIT